MIYQENIDISTLGRGTTDVSDQVRQLVRVSGIRTGICHVFIHHTSASLMICENADPSVRRDLERFMARLDEAEKTLCAVADNLDGQPSATDI